VPGDDVRGSGGSGKLSAGPKSADQILTARPIRSERRKVDADSVDDGPINYVSVGRALLEVKPAVARLSGSPWRQGMQLTI
jgi:hypothetical protein